MARIRLTLVVQCQEDDKDSIIDDISRIVGVENISVIESNSAQSDGTTEIAKKIVDDVRSRDIYEWADPDTEMTVYVGQSVNTARRARAHIKRAEKPSLEKWLYKMIVVDHKSPTIRVVSTVYGKKAADKAEYARIKELMDQGVQLLNVKTRDPGVDNGKFKLVTSPKKPAA